MFEAILNHYSDRNITIAKKTSNHNHIIKLLVSEMPGNLKINLVNSEERNRTVLIMTTHLGYLEMIEILLRHSGINVDL